MRYFAICIALLLMGAMVFGLAGCGGGGGSSTTRTGTLDSYDGVSYIEWTNTSWYSYYDEWLCIAKSTGTATVHMSSNDFDTYLVILDDYDNIIADNDDSGSSTTNSSVSFHVDRDEVYHVLTLSRYEYETGDYTVKFSGNLESIVQVNRAKAGTRTSPRSLKSTTIQAAPKTGRLTPAK